MKSHAGHYTTSRPATAFPHGCLDFARRYRSRLTLAQMAMARGSAAVIGANNAMTWLKGGSAKEARQRAFISSTEPLDRVYKPAFRVDSRFEHYFRPTMVTDSTGGLHQDLIDSGLVVNSSPLRAAGS